MEGVVCPVQVCSNSEPPRPQLPERFCVGDVFQLAGEARHLATARRVREAAHLASWGEIGGGYFDLRPEPTAIGPLKCPSKFFEESSLPSPNTIATLVLDRLAYLTNGKAYRERSEQPLETFAGAASRFGL